LQEIANLGVGIVEEEEEEREEDEDAQMEPVEEWPALGS